MTGHHLTSGLATEPNTLRKGSPILLLTTVKRLISGLFLLCAVVLLSACEPAPTKFMGSDITGTNLGQSWALPDTSAVMRDAKSFPNQVQLVFFGFTQCPDICPAALSEVNEAMRLLGPEAKDVQVLMISVDPERDNPMVLSGYMAAFNPDFKGLIGSPEQLKQAASSFKAFYAKSPLPDGNYTMDHSTSFYLLDQKGEPRVLLSSQAGAAAIAHDVKALLN
jgi:protein SCO1/2